MRNKKGGMGGGKHRGGRRYHGGGGGGGGHSNHGGGGGNSGQNLARSKHHALQMREKYNNMARDAQSNGDRVDVEYYLQHVEHYTRVLADINVIEGERQAQFREQQQQTGGGDANNNGDNQSGGGDDANASGGGGGNDEQPIVQGNQPRMTGRGPRRESQNVNPNANGDDIPLPGSVLPAI